MCLCLWILICVLALCLFRILNQRVSALSTEFHIYALKNKKEGDVGSHVRHYWQNGGTAPNPLSLSRRHRPRMKELGLVILTCFLLSLVELAGKNVKVLIVLERNMRRHKAFCSCAQKIIHKVTIGICSRIFTKNLPGWAPRPQLEAMGRIVIWDLFVQEIFMAKEVCWVYGLGIIKNS